jgi:hypothetical protein
VKFLANSRLILVYSWTLVPLPKQSNNSAAARVQSLVDAERRTEARYPAEDPVELELLPGPSEPMYGTILDVSRSGLRVALPQRIDRGEQVKVKLHHNVIFGEVRHCRAVLGVFHVGILIQDMVRPVSAQNQHIADDPLSLYAVGKGLTVPEVIAVRQHLVRCNACRARLAEKDALLKPSTKGGPRRTFGSEPPA